ncbi:tRNA(Arg) A34 adenosine deaminase TadA [Haloactinospora alba]|uniref:tRNA(Arg) A34 adenosine deaminase TadA n=1 Tax=Haloactinospora alba TaxID=405555 RepID=A0A543NK95_9ACTN|nr:nucleoside deaminase [Haloactinospora alba]TQN32281.1 tRNA(Arg) A34 adenosine deaminase TadA [Haloactinospora alba]
MAVNDTDLDFLRRAIALSHTARAEGNPPFGSLLVGPDGTILAERTNTSSTDSDISAHPEFKLAVWAARALPPEQAAHTTMYTSCENCAMCSGAMVWSGLGRLVYALSCAQVTALQRGSVPTLDLASAEVFARADRPILSEGPALYEEAAAAHEGYW